MISTAYFLTVKDVLYQRLHQTADFFNVIRHRPLLDAKLVRHFLLGGSVIEQTEDPAILGLYLAEHGNQVFQDCFIDNIFLKRSLCGRLRTLIHQYGEGSGLIPLTAGLREVLALLTAVALRAADESVVFAFDHTAAIPVFPFDFRPDRRHIRPILLFGRIDHDYPAFAVSDAVPGDVFRFEAKIMDDLVRYHHRDLILLVLFFTLIYFHFVSFHRSSSGGHEESRRI